MCDRSSRVRSLHERSKPVCSLLLFLPRRPSDRNARPGTRPSVAQTTRVMATRIPGSETSVGVAQRGCTSAGTHRRDNAEARRRARWATRPGTRIRPSGPRAENKDASWRRRQTGRPAMDAAPRWARWSADRQRWTPPYIVSCGMTRR